MVKRAGPATKHYSNFTSNVVSLGLKATGTSDIWGKSKNVLLYVEPTTLPVTANGYAVTVRRDDAQRVVNDFYVKVGAMVDDYNRRGQQPVNCVFEIRISGLDKKEEVANDNPVSPVLSAVRRRPDHPEWDVAVWLDVLTVPGTKNADKFYEELENWIFQNYSGDYAGVRVEWSKGWAYTEDKGPWSRDEVLSEKVPDSVNAGNPPSDSDWNSVVGTLKKYDQKGLFSSPMLDQMLKERTPPEFTLDGP